ncbi:THUMP domain-containing protein 1 [Syngnathus typhle]|uniref:THUMP domain-containing protein 1 n=1 Tax=Syngnathus typhle TaxID=161592 RepID=UPI002A6A86DA|nr:THUMP domain-containing protein 1 [Syngnathus typhle]XP_061130911.1 THUMP domain-containing protein 1 [Syngnathus typhle]XP_061130912.1 THUMP domain-containing protein 1 [Syngnathus typhle]
MSEAQNAFRKRGKKHFFGAQHHAKRWRGSRELEVGMQGILITCSMNQRKCAAEAFNLLSEYADMLYGPEKFEEEAGECSEGENAKEEVDVEDALKKEVAQLRAGGGRQERRFQALDSGANNVIFIRTRNLESDKLVHHILSDLHATKKKKTRVILRMLPVTGTCKAFPEDMMRYMSTFLEPWFKKPNHATYQIAFKARNNSHNKREDVIKAIAGLVGKLNPKNKVNLTQPDLTIILEVIKSVCCVSVVREYTRYRKYNLQEVVKDEEPKKEDAPKDGQGDDAATEAALAGGCQAPEKEEDGAATEAALAGGSQAPEKEEDDAATEAALAGGSQAPEKEEDAAATQLAAVVGGSAEEMQLAEEQSAIDNQQNKAEGDGE